MCKRARRTHGTAARSVPVAQMLASEARRARASGPHEATSGARTTTPLTAFSRAIDRESLAGLGYSFKLAPPLAGLLTVLEYY